MPFHRVVRVLKIDHRRSAPVLYVPREFDLMALGGRHQLLFMQPYVASALPFFK